MSTVLKSCSPADYPYGAQSVRAEPIPPPGERLFFGREKREKKRGQKDAAWREGGMFDASQAMVLDRDGRWADYEGETDGDEKEQIMIGVSADESGCRLAIQVYNSSTDDRKVKVKWMDQAEENPEAGERGLGSDKKAVAGSRVVELGWVPPNEGESFMACSKLSAVKSQDQGPAVLRRALTAYRLAMEIRLPGNLTCRG